MTSKKESAEAWRPGADVDAALAAAQGVDPTSDDVDALFNDKESGETDIMGNATSVAHRDGTSIGGPNEIDRRDAHRSELDSVSARGTAAREHEASKKTGER
jgi:hypothetical protein